jgi:hypothetical protein
MTRVPIALHKSKACVLHAAQAGGRRCARFSICLEK